MSAPTNPRLPVVLRDAKYRDLKVGDLVQLAQLAPSGPAGEVVELLPPKDVRVEWYGYGYTEPQVIEACELRVSRVGDYR